MRLEAFDAIDEALAVLAENAEVYTAASNRINALFTQRLDDDCVINVVSRVKEAVSLKEKIIRKKLYAKHRSGKEIMQELSDVVGVRVECRFIKDEDEVFSRIKGMFSKQKDGYCYLEDVPDIGLELMSPQPQKQRNGLDIYRIDGIIVQDGKSFRFEMQIKSLVKVFWAEIEHKIVYKNNSYRLIDDFFRQLMLSINNTLVSIDQQLMLIYQQMQKHDSGESYMQAGATKQILAKAINDMLYNKMTEEIGFTVNFRKPCEILADFVFNNGVTGADAIQAGSMEVMVTLLYRIKSMRLDMQNSLHLERPLRFGDGFCRVMGETLSRVMNEDFEWNLFFRMLFIMEPENNSGDLEFFISYIRKEITARCPGKGSAISLIVLEDLLEHLAKCFAENPDIEFISRENLDAVAQNISAYLEQILAAVEEPAQWEKYRAHFLANASLFPARAENENG